MTLALEQDWMTLRWAEHLSAKLTAARNEGDHEGALRLAARLAGAVVVPPEEVLDGRVQFGSRVTIFAIEECEEQTFEIVSHDEANLGQGLLDSRSPLARALYGAEEGDEVEVIVQSGASSRYEVTHVRAPR